jgi:hypothetical protein
VAEAPGYRGEVDSGVRVEGSPAGPQEEAAAEEELVSDREKLTQALEERDRLGLTLTAAVEFIEILEDLLRDHRIPPYTPRESAPPGAADGEAAT